MKRKLIVVPHIFAEDVRIRDIEFAKRLTECFEEVYCLKWKDALHVNLGSSAASAASASRKRRWGQLQNSLKSLFAASRSTKGKDGITYLELPVLQPILLSRLIGPKRALSISCDFNTRILSQAIRHLDINYVLIASEMFNAPNVSGTKVFYDIVDWFPEEVAPRWQIESSKSHLKNLSKHVSAIFAVSQPLAEKLKMDCGIQAIPFPNGADLKALRSVSAAKVEAVIRQWGLDGKFVIGYIGNHGAFTGVDFTIEVFQSLRSRIPNATLLIVGPATHWTSRLGPDKLHKLHNEGVIFTGPIAPSDIPAYFHAIDIGLLAQEKSLGTEFAFQIKVVEYTACRKFVLSTPLLVWQRLGWPNVFLVERQVEAWANAICKLKKARWSPEWNDLVEPYDWRALSHQMAHIMLNL